MAPEHCQVIVSPWIARTLNLKTRNTELAVADYAPKQEADGAVIA